MSKPAPAISANRIYAILKTLIAELKKRDRATILAEMVLRDAPPKGLGFSEAGLRNLADHINNAFRDMGFPITPELEDGETQKCKTLQDLFSLIRKRFKV
jgi:hypothetical protein